MADQITKDLQRRMESTLDVVRKEYAGLRTGRANANLLDPVQVEAYGNSVPLNQCGTVGVPEPRMLTVQVWDRSLIKAVERRSAMPVSVSIRRPMARPSACRSLISTRSVGANW